MSGVKSFQWPCLKVFFLIGDPPRDKWRLLAACWGSDGVPDLFPSRVESSPNRVLYGNDMRAEFCRDVFSSKHLVLSPLAWRSPVDERGPGWEWMGFLWIFGMNSTKFWHWTCGIALTWHWKIWEWSGSLRIILDDSASMMSMFKIEHALSTVIVNVKWVPVADFCQLSALESRKSKGASNSK